MSSHHKAAVWIDHHEARIFHVDADGFDEKQLAAPTHHLHRHPLGAAEARHHPDDLRRFLHDVTEALRDAEQILVFGPSTAKLQLLRHLREHEPAIEKRVSGVETVDHPTDRQLVAYVKSYFKAAESSAGGDSRTSAV
jgi:stalled ribosome rescue protein Dom34